MSLQTTTDDRRPGVLIQAYVDGELKTVILPAVVQVDSSGDVVVAPTGAQIGAVNETAPATDTASSGLNGRLQRIAQRLTTLIASVLAVKSASATTATRTDAAAAVADTSILAANAARYPGSTVTNDSTAILYLLLGSGAASATNFTVAIDGKTTVPGSYRLPDGYTGAVRGYWATATGSARITELSA